MKSQKQHGKQNHLNKDMRSRSITQPDEANFKN